MSVDADIRGPGDGEGVRQMAGTRRGTAGLVAGAVGLVLVAGTGGAVAAGLVTSAQIKDNTVASVDLRNGSAAGVDVKDGSLTGADVGNGSLTGADVGNGSLTGADVQDGSLTGADVAGGVGTVRYAFQNGTATNNKAVAMTLPAGSYVLTGSMWASTSTTTATSASVVCQFATPTAGPSLPGGDGYAVFTVHAVPDTSTGYGRTISSVPVTLASAGNVTWSCSKFQGANVSLYQARLQAVPVGGVVEGGPL
jgi:uncharacterized protein YjbI with pentapeptide repeats